MRRVPAWEGQIYLRHSITLNSRASSRERTTAHLMYVGLTAPAACSDYVPAVLAYGGRYPGGRLCHLDSAISFDEENYRPPYPCGAWGASSSFWGYVGHSRILPDVLSFFLTRASLPRTSARHSVVPDLKIDHSRA